MQSCVGIIMLIFKSRYSAKMYHDGLGCAVCASL
jgi:hypothetical protein